MGSYKKEKACGLFPVGNSGFAGRGNVTSGGVPPSG